MCYPLTLQILIAALTAVCAPQPRSGASEERVVVGLPDKPVYANDARVRQPVHLPAERQRLDKMFLNVVDLTDKLNQAESLRQNLEEVNKQAMQQMSQMKMVLDRHGLAPDSLVAHIPPKVEGVVIDVNDKDLLEISIGSDDGLKVGHSLDVYRGNTYLGRIVIRKTNPDRAVGQIQKELQRGQIKRGDRVTTKFS